MWPFRQQREGFPKGFHVERTLLMKAKGLVDLPIEATVEYLRGNTKDATGLLNESYDKRYSPAAFIREQGDGFEVGWFTRHGEYECVREFSNVTDAATDYVLFSLGKGRWNPH